MKKLLCTFMVLMMVYAHLIDATTYKTGLSIDFEKLDESSLRKPLAQKPEILIVLYMAARNDLFPFAGRNIKQLQHSLASDRIKIFIRFDMQKPGEKCVTKHFFIDKNKVMQIGEDLDLDSGDEQSFVYTVQRAYELFPADELMIVLWNHGTGAIEPDIQRAINPSELFRYNTHKGIIELDRSVGFLDYISQGESSCSEPKGICFDDAYGNYLTIQKLTNALRTISQMIKKKIKFLACDACLMAGADVFIGLEPYVHYFIASQEVELGTGYRYDIVLDPLLKGTIQFDAAFAQHIVSSFKEEYTKITQDYTHCAIDLTEIEQLEHAIDTLARLLIFGLDQQKGKSVKEAIRLSKHKNFCMRFDEPTLIDFGHFCSNLRKNIARCDLVNEEETTLFREKLAIILDQTKRAIKSVVIANTTGKNLPHATGVSIYFPEFIIHKSYHHNSFANKTDWLQFLKKYLAIR